jgi:VWFA-related protein
VIPFLLLALTLAGTVPAARQDGAAQGTDDEPTVLRVNTRLVQVDVIVTDDDGPVGDLTQDDFTILDEGTERAVQVFTVTRSEPHPDAEPLPEGVVSNRVDWKGETPQAATVILMDRFNTLGPDQPYMDQQARKFMDRAVENNERVAVYELSDNGLRILGDYRSPPAKIREALDGVRPTHSLALANSLGALDDFQPDQNLLLFLGQDALSPFDQQVRSIYLENRMHEAIAVIEAIARDLSDLPGRKNLVWLASSFPFMFNAHDNPNLDDTIPFSTLERMEQATRLITDLNLAIYPVDVRGLGSSQPTELGIMETLADMTGGRAYYNTNGLAEAMEDAVQDTRVTYTLGFYVAEEESDTGFHDLDVKVDREHVDVRHRLGYYGFGADPPVDAPATPEQIMANAFNATALGLLARATPAASDPDQFQLNIMVDVNDMGLSRVGEGGAWRGSLTSLMYFYRVGEEETIVLPEETYSVELTDSQLETSRQTGFLIRRVVDTENQPGFLRIVVQDSGTGATGSIWLPLGVESLE